MDPQAPTPRAGATLKEPKTPLNELFMQFRESASDPELGEAHQKFAARLCLLTRHLQVLAARQAMLALKDEAQQKQLTELDKNLAAVIESFGPLVQGSAGADAGGQEPPKEGEATEAAAASEESTTTMARGAEKGQATAPNMPPPARRQTPPSARRQTTQAGG